jgi:arylsulfatase A-like enzyme
MTDAQKALISGLYDAEVATQDEQLGSFFARLRAAGVLDRTFVVITADHGEHLSEKEFVGHSYSLYNELTHVPLMVRDPRGLLPHGATVDHVVSTRRVFHTMLAAAGLAEEAERRLSLAHYGDHDPDRGLVFSEAVTPQNVLNVVRKHEPDLIRRLRCDQDRRAVWKGRYKLILTGDDMVELYDFMGDPKETKNLQEQMPEVVRQLSEHWRAYERYAQAAAVDSGGTVTQDDPALARRLRALGYLE